ncbi:TniB family NTP-binding protein [Paenibacillus sp. MBLB2552]|uniref:TniB family NTP-binding protein n=1 Tax=Paenibacillus mellifer TaxID=2937794 RepID=A0A9X1Y254_9BACL|nr:AAA family ATPase [Paenibacillus mellifer]MCK8488276.1 TniB family NTP-binding protein [Paenibacillus mellifer]
MNEVTGCEVEQEESFGFPKHLLDKSTKEKINYFKKYTVAHPLLTEAYNKFIDNIFNPSNRSIQFLYGPSGVGKTTIYKKVQSTIIERMMPVLEMDKGVIPYAALEAVASDTGIFDWKDFYIRLLEEFREIAINNKIDYDALRERDGLPKTKAQDPNRKFRIAVESTLKNRRPIVLLIDEAQHMMKMANGRRLRSQMDAIKSMASLSNTPIVLIGTYELLQFTNLSGQLSRRSDDVHFQRYRMDNPEHMDWFESSLYMFQKNMPLKSEPDLVGNTDFFYERCIGCIGTLKDWLTKTLEMGLLKGNESLTMDDFREYALSLDQCIKMAREATEGEAKLLDSNEKRTRLYNLLMANTLPVEENEEGEKSSTAQGKKDNKTNGKGKSKNPKPGNRKPKRDATGWSTGETKAESDADAV